jgi:hypothetical protein
MAEAVGQARGSGTDDSSRVIKATGVVPIAGLQRQPIGVSGGCDQQTRDLAQITASGLGGGHALFVTVRRSGVEPKTVELRFHLLQACLTT